MNSRNFSIFFSLFFLVACIEKPTGERDVDESFDTSIQRYPDQLEVKYAEGFSLKYFDYWKELRIGPTYGIPEQEILLIERGAPTPEGYDGWMIIEVPVESVACQSTTHLAMIAQLDRHETVDGFAQTDLIRDEEFKKRHALGKIRELSRDQGFDVEQVVDLSPEVLFTFPFEQRKIQKVEEAGVQQVWVAEYLEKHPLAQAEWLKLFAAMYNVESEAEEWFNSIETTYHNLTSLTDTAARSSAIASRPTVFLEIPYKDQWHMAPGNSYIGRLIQHAGGHYIWRGQKRDENILLTFEEVIDTAFTANYWLITGDFKGEMDPLMLSNIDTRFKEFEAYPEGVLINDLSKADRYSEGILEPHVMLSDLIHHFHQELLPDHDPVYFQKLK